MFILILIAAKALCIPLRPHRRYEGGTMTSATKESKAEPVAFGSIHRYAVFAMTVDDCRRTVTR